MPPSDVTKIASQRHAPSVKYHSAANQMKTEMYPWQGRPESRALEHSQHGILGVDSLKMAHATQTLPAGMDGGYDAPPRGRQVAITFDAHADLARPRELHCWLSKWPHTDVTIIASQRHASSDKYHSAALR